jgi:transcriptional regulator with XRE-family HTH domain
VPSPDPEEAPPLGQAVRERREEIGITQEALAHMAGMTPKRVWEIERRSVNPTKATLEAIAAALFVPVESFTIREKIIAGDRERAKAERRNQSGASPLRRAADRRP